MAYSKWSKGEIEVVVGGVFCSLWELQQDVAKQLDFELLSLNDFYMVHNGKVLKDDDQVEKAFNGKKLQPETLKLVLRVRGGKGGFGSMLRAIGAQIEKTTNRDACRDLSGRRLRDINEEQRLKKWFAKQAEREQEKQEAKKRKLEKLRVVADGPALPKIDDQEYLQKREDIVEAVFEAVDEGSSGSKTTTKPKEEVKKTLKKTMFEEDLDSASSSDDGEEDEEIPKKVAKLA